MRRLGSDETFPEKGEEKTVILAPDCSQ